MMSRRITLGMTRKEFMLAIASAAGVPWVASARPGPDVASGLQVPARGRWRHEELRRFKAREAHQGVATDGEFVYAISNRAIGKYRIETGERLSGWEGEKGGPIVHLNAGTVRDGRLHVAHSNYPGVPMLSSVEIWDSSTMQHVGTHSLGIDAGSLTWVAWRDGCWFACFAHYSTSQGRTGRDASWTQLVRFDEQWRREAGWVFPPDLIVRFGGNSSSGGGFGPEGLLFVTGHDAKELYALAFPEAGSVLRWTDTVSIGAEGQAFDFDPRRPGFLYSLMRRTGEVIVSRLFRGPP